MAYLTMPSVSLSTQGRLIGLLCMVSCEVCAGSCSGLFCVTMTVCDRRESGKRRRVTNENASNQRHVTGENVSNHRRVADENVTNRM
jgi:hypothetical protein